MSPRILFVGALVLCSLSFFVTASEVELEDGPLKPAKVDAALAGSPAIGAFPSAAPFGLIDPLAVTAAHPLAIASAMAHPLAHPDDVDAIAENYYKDREVDDLVHHKRSELAAQRREDRRASRDAHFDRLERHHERRRLASLGSRIEHENLLHNVALAHEHETVAQRQLRLRALERAREKLQFRLKGLQHEVAEAQEVEARLHLLTKKAKKSERLTAQAASNVQAAEHSIIKKAHDLAKLETRIKGHAAVITSIVNKHRKSISLHQPRLIRTLERLQRIVDGLAKHTDFNSRQLRKIRKLQAVRPTSPSWRELKRYISLREKAHEQKVLTRLATQHQLGKLSGHIDRLITVLSARLAGTPVPAERRAAKKLAMRRRRRHHRRIPKMPRRHRRVQRSNKPERPLSQAEALTRLGKVQNGIANLEERVIDSAHRAALGARRFPEEIYHVEHRAGDLVHPAFHAAPAVAVHVH